MFLQTAQRYPALAPHEHNKRVMYVRLDNVIKADLAFRCLETA